MSKIVQGLFTEEKGYRHDFPDILTKAFPDRNGNMLAVSMSYGVDTVVVYPFRNGDKVQYGIMVDYHLAVDQEPIMMWDADYQGCFRLLMQANRIFEDAVMHDIFKDFILLIKLTREGGW